MSTPRPNMPSKYAIAAYWAASPDRGAFAPRMYDLGEPSCFACGWYSEHWDKGTPKASWQRATLERAHIVPHALGGPSDVSNLVLLCAPCHADSPDWHEPSAMAAWIAVRPSRSSQESSASASWLDAATAVPDLRWAVEVLGPDVVSEAVKVAAGKATTHMAALSPGTKVAILRDAVTQLTEADRG